jgi:hypothetical protein
MMHCAHSEIVGALIDCISDPTRTRRKHGHGRLRLVRAQREIGRHEFIARRQTQVRVQSRAIRPACERGRRVRKAAEPRAKPRLGLVGARVGALARELR